MGEVVIIKSHGERLLLFNMSLKSHIGWKWFR